MKILGIDTTGQTASAALVEDDKLICEFTLNYKLTHSQTIMPMIAEIIERSETDKASIDCIACAAGPGSFTGLRIGLATAEAMAYSWQCLLHGVDTLKALAYNIPIEGLVLSPVLDAQKGNYYQALYQWQEGKLVELAVTEVVNKYGKVIVVEDDCKVSPFFLKSGVWKPIVSS